MKLLTACFLFFGVSCSANSRDSFFLARSCGKLTMLANGLGDDRLGGAKIGYIDTGILLRIIDSANDLFKVQLSKTHTAYVSRYDIQTDSFLHQLPFYLTNSFSVKGDDTFDFVSIKLDEKLPYKSWMEINPAKIYLDIYGVQSNTNWITQLKSVKEIKDVYINQVEDDVVRVVIELKHRQHWGYSVYYEGHKLNVRVRRQPVSLKAKNILVAIDAGHGGSNTGATGTTTKGMEKNFTLRFANELERFLSNKSVPVFMTRTTDTNINNVDRVLMLQAAMPNILVSLHFNSSANPGVQGASTYYKHIGFKPLTAALLHRLLELQLGEFGNVGNFNFTLNVPTDFPNVLVEIAFLSNADDEKKITNPKFEKQVAKKIYKGIKDWLKTASK